jgi:hypothetical protein
VRPAERAKKYRFKQIGFSLSVFPDENVHVFGGIKIQLRIIPIIDEPDPIYPHSDRSSKKLLHIKKTPSGS